MANNFKNHLTANINNFANVGGFAVKEGQVATIIGLSLANMNNVAVTADVQINQGIGPAGNITIVKAAPIPVGGALVVVGGDQKVVLEGNHSLQVRANSTVTPTVGNVDAVMSILESDVT